MRILLALLFQLSFLFSVAQEILFKEPLIIEAWSDAGFSIKLRDELTARGIANVQNRNGGYQMKILAKNKAGEEVNIDPKQLYYFEFKNIDNLTKAWDKQLLSNGTYANLITKGYQYDLRSELNDEAVNYINTLSSSNRLYDDAYLEDYLYTLLNKIHPNLLSDKRPGNISIKIIKDIEPNAYALPNGCILISTGLLSTIQSEDELVGVLAHEVAHFVLDHQVLNYNQQLDREKRAAFWSGFAVALAAGIDIYFASKDINYIPGVLTTSTAILTTAFTYEVLNRLGLKYSQEQESASDKAAKDILTVLGYNPSALAVALERIKDYCLISGNYSALAGNGTHPALDVRINSLGGVVNKSDFTQTRFIKRVSFVNSYNARIQLWSFANHPAAYDLSNRNITYGIATEIDYIIKAIVQRRMYDTKESNEQVLALLLKAKALSVNPPLAMHKEEGIACLRLEKKTEAKGAFQSYLTALNKLKSNNDIHEITNANKALEEEISWTTEMIFKVDRL